MKLWRTEVHIPMHNCERSGIIDGHETYINRLFQTKKLLKLIKIFSFKVQLCCVRIYFDTRSTHIPIALILCVYICG